MFYVSAVSKEKLQLRLLLEWILQNQAGHLMLFTKQKSYHFYTTEILFQMVKEV